MLAVPAALIDFLCGPNGMPRFSREPLEYQKVLATMLWLSLDWRRRHWHYKGAYSFTTSEIQQWFGSVSTFQKLNRHPSSRYYIIYTHRNGGTGKQRFTNAYKPTPWWQAAFDRFLVATEWQSDLFKADGRVIRTAPRSVASIDRDGNHVKGWSHTDAPSLVPVNLGSLKRLERHWQVLMSAHQAGVLPPTVDYPGDVEAAQIVRTAAAIRHHASSKQFSGHVLHQYVPSTAGRLFATGVNLQNCPKVVRKAALAGSVDYDISCCHFAILMQMAERLGCTCPDIADYVKNKSAVRALVAAEAGIKIQQVKVALTALIYGARASTKPENAIPTEIGVEAAMALYASQTFRAIKSDIARATKVVIDHYPRKNGRYINLFGKAAPAGSTRVKIMAHLLQGVESVALRAAVRTCPDKVLLLQHDGFTASHQVDVDSMVEAVCRETGGYRLSFEEELLRVDLPDFDEAEWAHESKMREGLESTADAGFSPISGDLFGTVGSNGWRLPPPYPDIWPTPDISDFLYPP